MDFIQRIVNHSLLDREGFDFFEIFLQERAVAWCMGKKENEKKNIMTRVLMLTQCACAPENDRCKENHCSPTLSTGF